MVLVLYLFDKTPLKFVKFFYLIFSTFEYSHFQHFHFMVKKILSIVGLVWMSVFSSHAQTIQDIFNSGYPVTWLGIDYSHSKIVGKMSQFGGKTPVSAAEIHDTYYAQWNQLILDEPEKYDVAKMISRKTVVKDISMVTQLNAASSMDSVEVVSTPSYIPEQIQKFVSSYPLENKSGIGMIFITESMHKSYGGAYYHVVFFKMDTKEILLQQRVQGLVQGSGIRNYWATTYFDVIEYMRDEQMPRWKKRYGSSTVTPQPKW